MKRLHTTNASSIYWRIAAREEELRSLEKSSAKCTQLGQLKLYWLSDT